jgi:hypothetical protein
MVIKLTQTLDALVAERVPEIPDVDDEQARIEAERDARCRRANRADLLDRVGVCLPDKALDALLDGRHDDRDAIRLALEWWRTRSRPWHVLSGPGDIGKTFAAAAVVDAANGGVFLWSQDLVRALSSRDAAERERVIRAKLVVIDDLGTEEDAVRMQQALIELLDKRSSARSRPTLVTTNLTKKAFVGLYPNTRLRRRMRDLVEWTDLQVFGGN